MATVEILSVQGTKIRVRGLDAIDGSPVIDIKPFTPPYDEPKGEVRVPAWVERLAY
ncbi:hypothetical protein OP10G_0417 [Fimbriimonas ginsengisoli Gsoil 348]|uniref:TsaA-like domain-containing protein n=1 Tax=Fimbriimonas ginsengisoli Gsoil 348 TaxID=661478 RepID=A0A068NLX8_FIMGI|nr:hypothetical protein OP10G_0417 [Fimbriimonas ginsengisoli Gsoil 348]